MEYFDQKYLDDFGSGKLGEDKKEYWDNFLNYYGNVFKEGKLTVREKQLIALAVAQTQKCPYCIEAYTTACLESGVTKEEMAEVTHVAASMAAGIVLVNSIFGKNLADSLEF